MPTVFLVEDVPEDKWQWIDRLVADGLALAIVRGISGVEMLAGKGIDAVLVDTSNGLGVVTDLADAIDELADTPAIVLMAGTADSADVYAAARGAGLPLKACAANQFVGELRSGVPRAVDDVPTAPGPASGGHNSKAI